MPELLARAHGDVAGSRAAFAAFTATTDARYVEGGLCYGPIAGNLHGADEWVDSPRSSNGARRCADRPRWLDQAASAVLG